MKQEYFWGILERFESTLDSYRIATYDLSTMDNAIPSLPTLANAIKCRILLTSAVLFIFSASAFADGIDIVAYFTRVGSDMHSSLYNAVMVLLLMVANYMLNFAVIGWPVAHFGRIPLRTVGSGLIALTLLGQIADRGGALLAAGALYPLTAIFRINGLEQAMIWLLALNFLFSGLAVGGLAFYFARKRWGIGARPAWAITAAAGLLTNPAWAIGTWFIR